MEQNRDLYLGKSLKIFKYYGGLILFAMVFSIIVAPFAKEYPSITEFVVGIPLIIFIILAPVGLIFSIKAVKNKEGTGTEKILHNLGHGLLTLIAFYFLYEIINDLINR